MNSKMNQVRIEQAQRMEVLRLLTAWENAASFKHAATLIKAGDDLAGALASLALGITLEEKKEP